VDCHSENFGEMQRASSSALLNLFATTESVGDDEPVRGRTAYGWQKFQFSDGK
jgi:hypothetical protein